MNGLSPEEFFRLAREAGHDALGLANDINPENYTWEQLVGALEKVFEKYPAVYRHFFFSELDPEAYHFYLLNLIELLRRNNGY